MHRLKAVFGVMLMKMILHQIKSNKIANFHLMNDFEQYILSKHIELAELLILTLELCSLYNIMIYFIVTIKINGIS